MYKWHSYLYYFNFASNLWWAARGRMRQRWWWRTGEIVEKMLAKRKMLLVRFELKLAIFWLLSCTKNESINRNISKFSCLLVQAAIVQLITITDIVSISHSNPMHIVSLNGSIWTRERERETSLVVGW